MALSESEDPPKQLSKADRSNSTHSITKASPSSKARKPKAHVVGTHSRNRSIGKNLNEFTKLAKAAADDGPGIRRNSSGPNLPRTGSKVSIKKNTSNVSLKRNGSSTHVNKTSSRPTTPLRRNKSQNEDLAQNTGGKVTFEMDDENNDDEWTEESASQSPSITRHSSASRGGGRSGISTPGGAVQEGRPESSDSGQGASRRDRTQDGQSNVTNTSSDHPRQLSPTRQKSKPPDADAITSRLLNRGTSSRNLTKVTSVSATGTPGTHTPPHNHEPGSLGDGQSMPENGISRFLNANSSSRESTWQLHNALNHLNTPPNADGVTRARSQSTSPSRDETVRRARSAQNLSGAGRAANGPIAVKDSSSSKGPVSYTFEPPNRRPQGGNTQAKLELWRLQGHVEPSHGPPVPLTKGVNAANMGMLSTEERRARVYDEAEAALGHLRRFRNPTVEAAKRAIKLQKRREKELRAQPAAAQQAGGDRQANGEHRKGKGSVGGGGGGGGGGVNGESSRHAGHVERGRRDDSRPVSRAGPRNVRFEVGLDPGEDIAESPEADEVQALLKSLWAGGEMENVRD